MSVLVAKGDQVAGCDRWPEGGQVAKGQEGGWFERTIVVAMDGDHVGPRQIQEGIISHNSQT